MPSNTSGPTSGAKTDEVSEPEKSKRSGAYDIVRVRDGGREFSITRAAANRARLKEVSEKDATDEHGRPAAPKPIRTASQEA